MPSSQHKMKAEGGNWGWVGSHRTLAMLVRAATAASVPPGSGKQGIPGTAAPLLLAIHGTKKGTKICAWPNNQSWSVPNSLWRKFMQKTRLQSFLQCALWCVTWLWVKAKISISCQVHKYLLRFQWIFVYEWRRTGQWRTAIQHHPETSA